MNKMTKIILIAAASLILCGGVIFCIIMSKFNWDFKKLSTTKYTTMSHTITEGLENISIKITTADVILIPTNDKNAKVTCYENVGLTHSVVVEDNTLMIAVEDSRKWYERINIDFNTPTITVYLPEAVYAKLSIDITTGDIVIKDTEFSQINLKNTTGDCTLTNITCGDLISRGTTGDITLTNVIASGNFTINRTTGDVEFERCDAATLNIKVTTGDIEGTLLSGKTFVAKTTTGDVEVPNPSTGGNCYLQTTTGDIEIEIVE